MTALAAERLDVVETQETVEQAAAQDDSVVSGSQAAHERQVGRAWALPELELSSYRGNLPLARFNLRVGLGNLKGVEPKYSFAGFSHAALSQVLDVVDALGFSLSRKRLVVKAASDLPALKTRVYRARRIMLASFEAVAEADNDAQLLAQLREITKGSGFVDAADDAADLAQLYLGKPARFDGRSPVTRALALQADEDGRALQALVAPKGSAKPGTPERSAEDVEIDRLWTLIVLGHREMRRAGYLVWADAFDAFVPPLLSREAPPRKTPPSTPPQG